MGVPHREVVEGDREKKGVKKIGAVGDGFGRWGVAARTGHRPVSLS